MQVVLTVVALLFITTPALAQMKVNSVGYIGCSNSRDTVTGYHLPSNRNYMWPSYDTGGGSIDRWVSLASSYWSRYSGMVAQYGQPKYVWVQLCERAGSPNSYTEVKSMISSLRTKSPGTIVIVSGINDYSPNPGLCTFMGTASATSPGNGVFDTKTWADRLVTDKLAEQRGPYLGPLTKYNTVSDHCHPNATGRELLGKQLRAVVDALL